MEFTQEKKKTAKKIKAAKLLKANKAVYKKSKDEKLISAVSLQNQIAISDRLRIENGMQEKEIENLKRQNEIAMVLLFNVTRSRKVKFHVSVNQQIWNNPEEADIPKEIFSANMTAHEIIGAVSDDYMYMRGDSRYSESGEWITDITLHHKEYDGIRIFITEVR